MGLPCVFSEVIDRECVSTSIVRAICNVWRKINCATFVTDEQNELSLCPAEGPRNLLVSERALHTEHRRRLHVAGTISAGFRYSPVNHVSERAEDGVIDPFPVVQTLERGQVDGW